MISPAHRDVLLSKSFTSISFERQTVGVYLQSTDTYGILLAGFSVIFRVAVNRRRHPSLRVLVVFRFILLNHYTEGSFLFWFPKTQ